MLPASANMFFDNLKRPLSGPRPVALCSLGHMVNYVHTFTQCMVCTTTYFALFTNVFGCYDELTACFTAGKVPFVIYLIWSLGPGQPRLDSGGLPAGWFPLPDAAARAFGLPPICPLWSVFDVP